MSVAKRLMESGHKGRHPFEGWKSETERGSAVALAEPTMHKPLPGQRSFLDELDDPSRRDGASQGGLTFFLGTHQADWLGKTDVPLFVSRRRLEGRKKLPAASGGWALDSGGFTELGLYGRWKTSPRQYADEAAEWAERIGNLEFAASQDWMCEPVVRAKTGKSVREHQDLSIESYLTLRALAPSVPWLPVLQGWAVDDYLEHVELYARAGVALAEEPRVGVGSVCRRQGTREVLSLFCFLQGLGLSLHGFGVKTKFVKASPAGLLASCDSLAWSSAARRRPSLPGCRHQSCANCLRFAMDWRARLLAGLRGPKQGLLFMGARP